ncbi:hypothetical protein IW140_000339 [Coemansia sp. RSA 1813]|nr:hypothetical protein EV178_000540 [Coemansia sp. RSA 1646]KAJ1773694.1 hypothetical protein LPJ74_000236 [Coemansia sp. RSA 1843]KAJ2093655.1 hypothetical protein IW138_000049 [Coemansia sp. RSA 986]KAJ2217868.1 hypothetical protein EV179_000011 [Coemansia sp. RSA 487]KAJ2573294.1 hypothetical protein IW140_000339 [Coemansia sp. RSA 1813]
MSTQSDKANNSALNDNVFQTDEGGFVRSYYGDSLAFGDTAAKMFIHEQRRRLPAFKHRMQFLYATDNYSTVIVVGEPGSGKSTQLPQFLYEAGWASDSKVIGCTQPRRVAAAMLAQRVAEEMDVPLGSTVGYSVRFADASSADDTRIKYMTDGTMIRECFADPLLSKYSVVMVDEAQDRSLNTDVLLALLKKIQKQRRHDFCVIISSATMDAERFREYFETNSNSATHPENNTATIMSISGRLFPVDIHYLTTSCENYLASAVETVVHIHETEPVEGDILVFLPGKDEIEQTIAMLHDQIDNSDSSSLASLIPMAMYAGLPFDKQKLVFDPPRNGSRKAVFATNVAEASVTIDGVVFVVDSGFAKKRILDPRTGIGRLATLPISKASATQRAGRSGRTQPGRTYRLFTQAAYSSSLFPQHDVPEVCRLPLESMALVLKALGVSDLEGFDYIQKPPTDRLTQAFDVLSGLRIIDPGTRELTPDFGLHIAELPLDPRLGVCLLNSVRTHSCAKEAIAAVSMLSIDSDPFIVPSGLREEALEDKRDFMVQEGDILTLVNVLIGYQDTPQRLRTRWCNAHFLRPQVLEQAFRIGRQLEAYLDKMGYHQQNASRSSCGREFSKLQRCLVSGFFDNAAKLNPSDGRYRLAKNGVSVDVHPSSILFAADPKPDHIVFAYAMETTKVYIRGLTAIDPLWLAEATHNYDSAKQKYPKGYQKAH